MTQSLNGSMNQCQGLLGVAVSYRDFLELRGLLAADAIAGLESLDVTQFAKVTHSVEFPIPDRVKSLDLKCSIGFHRSFDPDLAVGKAFVLQGMKQISGGGGKGLILFVYPQCRALLRDGEQFSFQGRQMTRCALGGAQRGSRQHSRTYNESHC
jgi:hypothetical protein